MNASLHASSDSDQEIALEIKISKLLRAGVIVSGVLLTIGWLGQLAFLPQSMRDFQIYHEEPLFKSLQSGLSPWTAIEFIGLFLLLILPSARVLLTGILLWRKGDRLLALIAVAVFAVIVASCLLGLDFI